MKLKKVLSILLVAVMLLSVIPLSAYAASSGTFNTGLSWNIDDDGLLTFSGSGAIPMDGFERNADVKKVIINNSVTEIGSYAFFGCGNLTEVDIQNPSVSLPSNTAAQFSNCNNLTTVTIPEGVTIITQSMFRSCTSLTTIKLPSTITTIRELAFYSSGLQSISIPEGASFGNAYDSPFETNTLQSLTLEGSSPMTFTGNELTYLTGAVTVYIPEGSVYEDPGTTSLAVNDALEDEDEIEYAQEMLVEYAEEAFEEYISYGRTPEEALQSVNEDYPSWGETPMYMIITTEPCTVTLNEGDTCEPVFGSATIGRYVPAPTTHTITWKNWDGTTLETDTEIEEGATPTYDGATPTKADDAQYTYTFAGWTPEVVAVTGDATYTAQFTPVAKFSVFVKKLTGGTITVSNVTGLTTVAQLKDLLVTETGVPASAMRLIFAGKQLADDKTLGECNIQKESTIHLVIRTYTITWKSDEATIIDTTNVAYGETPTHEDPAAYEDADYTYTFAGWTPEVTAVTGEATYTATYTATAKTQPVAEANGVKYESFDEALRAISTVNAKGQFLANGTVRLLADCAGNGYSIASGSNLIIDFNGKTYTVDAEPLAGSTGTKTQAFQLLKDSTV
ncbi:MAG: leucine-rich repeat protein, partial [Clostridia bacterium]|nr:leucine-rich repeat protein [Clostridia bacterium]